MRKSLGKIKDSLKEHSFFDKSASGEDIFVKSQPLSPTIGLILPLIFLLVISTKLFVLQVDQGFINLKLAEGNRLKIVQSSAPRGLILSDNGDPLVNNEPVYKLSIQTSKIKNIDSVDPKAFSVIGISKDEITKQYQNSSKTLPNEYFVLKDKIAREDAILLKSRLSNFSEFEVEPSYERVYSDPSLSHVLGYIGASSSEDIKKTSVASVNETAGKSGLENQYDAYLQGVPGEKKVEVDVAGKSQRVISNSDATIGNSLETSINKDLQAKAAELLKNAADELKTKGAIIAMDPRNGQIKAMVSYPYYDNTKMSSGLSTDEYNQLLKDDSLPLINRAISGKYPPGSSIKPFIALAGLETGVINASLSFDTPPAIEIGQWKFPDWKDHGVTDIKRAIAESNNVFFYALGGGWGPIKTGLGPDRIKSGLEKIGFGKKTSIDIPGEGEGFIPSPAWMKKTSNLNWFIGNTYNLSIGQGDLMVTPLQIANATSTIANGGKIYKPHFGKKIISPSGKTIVEFNDDQNLVDKDSFNADDLATVREGMRMTVTMGSAHSVFGDNFPIEVAGKTGTAQYGNEGKTHAWFTSFAPYSDPQLEITVLLEGGGEGYATAAPVAKQLYQWWADNVYNK
jgi:penicillin-binding protein 2